MRARKQFTMAAAPAAFARLQGVTARQQVAEVAALMQLGAADFTIVDVMRTSAGTVWFEVATLEQADLLVRARHRLKLDPASGQPAFTLHEVLTAEERAMHAQLWPRFLAAKAAGLPAQFCRARLYVQRKEVRP
jgi:hypothetical protein